MLRGFRLWSPPQSAFLGFRFPAEVIVVAIRWYLRYGLSYRDVEELLAERGIEVDHVTVYRWVHRLSPLLADAARFARHSPCRIPSAAGRDLEGVPGSDGLPGVERLEGTRACQEISGRAQAYGAVR
jgi:hypothetical protein